jgi:hypothetical protein
LEGDRLTKKWFKPKKHSGWRKSQKPSTRRRKLLSSTDRRKGMRSRYVSAGRKALALANVTEDKDTEKKARTDAKYFFKKVK